MRSQSKACCWERRLREGEHSDTYERHKNKVRKNVLLRFNVQSPALWCVEHRMLRGMWAARDCNVCMCTVLLFFAWVHRRSLCCMEKRITMIFHTNKKNFLLPFRVTLFFLWLECVSWCASLSVRLPIFETRSPLLPFFIKKEKANNKKHMIYY